MVNRVIRDCWIRRNNSHYNEENQHLPVFSRGQGHWWAISKVFQPHGWHLVSRKLAWKRCLPMERSIFQKDFFANLSSDSDSSRKTVWRNCLSFLEILRGSWSNKQKTRFLRVSLTYPYISRFLVNLVNFQSEYWKNKDSLCSYFFERNLNLASEYIKDYFEKLTFT